MAERKAVTRELAARYRRASKKGKGVILTELCELTGWHRDYARRALRAVAQRPPARRGAPRAVVARRPRPLVYGEEVMVPLRLVWAVLDFPCGKRLAPAMAAMVESLGRHRELDVGPEVRAALLSISAATIDRRLSPDRRRLQIKGRTGTKPGSLLKGRIPIRTFADWDDTTAGFAQVDLVGHDGGNSAGFFAQTLTLTDVATGWTEPKALRNKARRWVVEAIDEVRQNLPFPLLGLDSDNGAEFINDHLFAYCAEREITFTRGRPYRKNDSCHVEQKNWSVVRQAVGYARFDTDAEVATLAEVYRHLRLLTNFFIPQAKLIAKSRDGAKVSRQYDTPTTPYERLLASGALTKSAARALTATYHKLNPAQLRRDVAVHQRRLLELTKTKTKSA
jgi:hypothetical protein